MKVECNFFAVKGDLLCRRRLICVVKSKYLPLKAVCVVKGILCLQTICDVEDDLWSGRGTYAMEGKYVPCR